MNKNRGFKLVHGVGTSDADYQVTTHSIVNVHSKVSSE